MVTLHIFNLELVSDITQWAIWAIRNACEAHPANQAVVAQLEQRGVANPDLLKDCGCMVEVGDDGKLKISRHKQ